MSQCLRATLRKLITNKWFRSILSAFRRQRNQRDRIDEDWSDHRVEKQKRIKHSSNSLSSDPKSLKEESKEDSR